ncbi:MULTISPECIES: DUF1350 family protein [unclassified Microcoleus]|uniref:DUF1350 family protein n=2 Tax=unclassified Microcoleus TaxID=2642155 RepID=UPI0025D4A146|nr:MULTISPECIES: DUF1350 family protein [unclassified Microcoleus]
MRIIRMQPVFKFQPISFSWVALHPQPKGVIQFIGGTFFGTFPTVFYRDFLKKLFADGYTIVALPFRFSFRHWPIAVSLLQEQEILRKELTEVAKKLGWESDIYQERSSYFWVGHSLGCKYIALLEFLSDANWQNIANQCYGQDENRQIQKLIYNSSIETPSIKGQPSLLIAPDISNTESAIPIRALAVLLDKLGLGVRPTRAETQCFIASSSLFNLTALISFDRDDIAGSVRDIDKSLEVQKNSDVLWLVEQLKARDLPVLTREIEGTHLSPIAIETGNYIVGLNHFNAFIKPIKYRLLEAECVKFLSALKLKSAPKVDR